MKATGIVRRIDDLGRVVVPKEIRRTMRIREGDPLEIFTDREGEIILKKYSPIGEISAFAKQYAETLAQITGHIVCVTDRDHFIAVSGGARKELFEKHVSKELERIMNDREVILADDKNEKYTQLSEDGEEEYSYQIIQPIISEGDVIGSVVLLTKDGKVRFGEVEAKLAAFAAGFLGRQMEQ